MGDAEAVSVRDTSLDAYAEIVQTLGHRQRQVFEEIVHLGEVTNNELARALFMPINRITPRVFELRAIGAVIDAGTRTCRVTRRRCHVWRPANGERQMVMV